MAWIRKNWFLLGIVVALATGFLLAERAESLNPSGWTNRIVVLLLFLGNVRSAITVGVVLPLTVLGAFVAMQFIGLTANLMSLGGIAIAIGGRSQRDALTALADAHRDYARQFPGRWAALQRPAAATTVIACRPDAGNSPRTSMRSLAGAVQIRKAHVQVVVVVGPAHHHSGRAGDVEVGTDQHQGGGEHQRNLALGHEVDMNALV